MFSYCAALFLLSLAGFLFWLAMVVIAYVAPGLGRLFFGGVLILAMAAVFPLAAGLIWPILGRLRGVMAREPGRRRGMIRRAPLWLRLAFGLSLLYMVFELVFVLGVMRGGTVEPTPLGGGNLEVNGQTVRQLSPAAFAFYDRQQALLLPSIFLFGYSFLITGYGAVLDTYRPGSEQRTNP